MRRTGLFAVAVLAATASVLGSDAAQARTFQGTGDAFLPLPGCKSVSRVLVGDVELPPYVAQKFPIDNDAKEHVATEWPLYDLSEDDSGTPCLMRSVQSNDGIWQSGVSITVVGEWEEEPKTKKQVPANSPQGGA
jgi:hypothetical protein